MKIAAVFFFMFFSFLGEKAFSAEESLGRVAILVSESGPSAVFGEFQKQGYELAEVNQSRDNLKVEVRYFDIASTSKLKKYFKNKVLSWKPDLLIGPSNSALSEDVLKIIEKKKIPIILPSTTKDEITRTFHPNVYRLALPSRILSKTVSDYLVSKQSDWKIREVYILAEESDFAQSTIAALRYTLPFPVTVIEDSRSLERKNATVIVVHRSPKVCIQICNELKDKAHILGFLAGFLTPEFRQYTIEKNVEVSVLSPWQDDSQNPLSVAFISQFKNKFSTAFSTSYPQYHSVQAYSALMIAGEVLQQHAVKKEPLNEILLNKVFKTPLGRVSFLNFDGYYQQFISGSVIQRYFEGTLKTVFPSDRIIPSGEKVEKELPFWKLIFDNQFIALFAIIAMGLLLGSIKIGPISLGSSGVLFAALLFGHFHFTIPSSTGTLGLILFIFCVGISAGPTFMSAFIRQGADLAKLSIVVISIAAITTILLAKFFSLPRDLAAGLLAGALTSTPAFASAMDTLKDFGTHVSVGYGIAYPFGVVGVVLFVQLVPKLLRKDLNQLSEEYASTSHDKTNIVLALVEVQNPAIIGKRIQDFHFISEYNCQVSRVLEGTVLNPIKAETLFQQGQIVRIVGHEDRIETVIDHIGKKLKNVAYEVNSDKSTMDIVVTSGDLIEKPLKKLELLNTYGITVTRILRNEKVFIPTPEACIEENDQLRVVGDEEAVKHFSEVCGHSTKALHETDLLSLSVGITAGVLIGLVPISLFGIKSFTLGLSGGLLLVSLLLGHFGRIGKIVGRIPIASRLLMMELGLVFFLANAGIKAGSSFIQTIQEYGAQLFIIGACITTIPLVLGFLFANYVLKINFLQILGGLCGGMTSTPALGAIRSKTDSEIPMVSYAAAYPVALIFMLIAAQIVLFVLKTIS